MLRVRSTIDVGSVSGTEADASPRRAPSRRWSVAALMLLCATAGLTFARAFDIQPLDGDNLWVLSWAAHTTLRGLPAVDPAIYPEWRPLPQATVWLQYQWHGVEAMAPYVAVNLFLAAACAWLVWRQAMWLTACLPAAALAALLALADARGLRAVIWIDERQNSMACLFGALALVHVQVREAGVRTRDLVLVALLLVASALSKEYGLAFAAGVAVCGVQSRHWRVVAVATASVVAYALIRMAVVSGATHTYCENMGFLFSERNVCVGAGYALPLGQFVYNAAATAVASVLPGILSMKGRIDPQWRTLVPGLVLGALAVYGTWQDRRVRPWTGVVVANALLNFLLFRDRNQLVAVWALGVAVAAGSVWALRLVPTAWRMRAGALAAVGGVLLLSARVHYTRALLDQEVAALRRGDPCASVQEGFGDLETARRVMARYHVAGACAAP